MMQLRSWINDHLTQPIHHLKVLSHSEDGAWYPVARIHYPINHYNLDFQDKNILNRLAITYKSLLPSLPRVVKLVFVGMADPSGRSVYNQALSKKRAKIAADYFFNQVFFTSEPEMLSKISIRNYGIGEVGVDLRGFKLNVKNRIRWRRVDVFTDLPPLWVESGISRLRKDLRKSVEGAVKGRREGIDKLKKTVKELNNRLGKLKKSSVYAENLEMLVWYEQQLKELEQSTSELLKSIDSGNSAYIAWRAKKAKASESEKEKKRYQEIINRLEKEKKRLQLDMSKNPSKVTQEIINTLVGIINRYEEDIKDLRHT
jgi:hypothetical protein